MICVVRLVNGDAITVDADGFDERNGNLLFYKAPAYNCAAFAAGTWVTCLPPDTKPPVKMEASQRPLTHDEILFAHIDGVPPNPAPEPEGAS